MSEFTAVENILEWTLSNRRPVRVSILDSVGVIGDGPIDSAVFLEMLKSQDVVPRKAPFGATTVIIGRNGWEKAQLETIIELRRGRNLRVYSQELFLAFLLAGRDPLDDKPGTLRKLGSGHPALDFLMSKGFRWPTTIAGPAKGGRVQNEWEEIGFLGYLGYKVGANGLYRNQRRKILEEAYSSFLPDDIFRAEYADTWGKPRSQERLKKIAYSIAAFCKNAQKKKSPPSIAIHDWELDMEWLKERFYSRRICRFRWPSTIVR